MAGRVITNSCIGEYRVLDFLGAGGMGEVYRAVHTKIGRVVAIKMLTQQEPSFCQRFLNEAQIQASVQHPNVATLYDFLVSQGLPCIVMEYVDGETLTQRIAQAGRLSSQQALPIMAAVVDAVGCVHRNGIIHRDIKSNNVKIDTKGRVKLLDFGIARTGASPKLTATGSVIGTLHYLSPELVKGGTADARSDIWALGVLFYEMLTGEVPFQGTNTLELCEKISRGSFRSPSNLDPSVPQEVEAIITKCLRKSPGDRYQSAESMLADLRRQEPARPITTNGRAGSSRSFSVPLSNSQIRWTGLAAILILAALVIYWIMGASPSPPKPTSETGTANKGAAATPGKKNEEFRTVIVDVSDGRADVYRSGQRVGSTPFEVNAAVGAPVELTLKRAGFADRRVQFDVSANRSVYTFHLTQAK